jgi:aspartate aminotransferase-like enzyme
MQVPEYVREAGDAPLFSHRSPQMRELLARIEARCRPVLGMSAPDATLLLLACSGTGAMESAICNLTSPGEEIIVVVGGAFAQRWVKIGEAYGLTVRVAEVDWRTGGTVAQIEQAMAQWPKAQVVFTTWSESSTGVLIDLSEIGKLVRSQNKFFVTDAVSGLAVSPMRMDEWKVDAVVAGSQKGLMMNAGLGIVAIGPRAWEKSEASRTARYYWDWKNYKGDVPFTPALSLLFEMEASLEYIHSYGMERIFARRAEVARRVRDLVVQEGMEVYALKPGNGITCVTPPKGFDTPELLRTLENEFAIQIAEGLGKLKGKTFRIGHVGYVSDEEVEYFIHSFQESVKQHQAI